MRTTIKDIANKTNLSITTVSLVLNYKECKISQKTKQLVLETAKELNYRPNQLAIGLVKKHTKTLGLILPDITSSFFAELAKAVEDEAAKNDYSIILCSSGDTHERDKKNIDMLIDKGVDGIILSPANNSTAADIEDGCDIAKRCGVPIVVVDRTTDINSSSTVTLDNATGGYIATKYLVDLGHTRIGFVTGPQEALLSTLRLSGAKRALAEAGIAFDETLCYEGDYKFDSGFPAAEYLHNKGITAVFLFNDLMAISFIRRIGEFGIKVPKDMSVIGFDNIVFSTLMAVPLTTVNQPIFEMGVSAAKMIIEASHQETESIHRMFMPSLIVRESTAPNTLY